MNEPGNPLSIQAVIDKAMEELRQGSKSRRSFGGKANVQNHNEEWAQLCQQAAVEKDPERLMRLVSRIVELLDARHGSRNPRKDITPVSSNGDSTRA